MKKRVVALMLAMGMTFTFCACGASEDSSSETAQEDSASDTEDAVEESSVEDTEDESDAEEAASEVADEETEVSYEGSGYASAEDAALAYLEALKAADFEAAAGTFAIETAVENADAEAYLERMGSYLFTYYYSFPMKIYGTGEDKQLLIILRYTEIAYSIFSQMHEYDGLMNDGKPITFSSDDRENEVREYLSDSYGSDYFEDMSNVEFVSFYSLGDLSNSYYDESNQNSIERTRVCYGADALEEVAMHIVLGGEDYLYCLQCAEYDGKWYVLQFSGKIGDLLGANDYANGLISFDEVGIG